MNLIMSKVYIVEEYITKKGRDVVFMHAFYK